MKLSERIESKEFFVAALVLVVVMHALDIVSTQIGLKLFGGYEANTWLQDPVTGGMLIGRSVLTKLLVAVSYIGIGSSALWYLTKSRFVASFPALMMAYDTFMGPVANNFTLLIKEIILRTGH
jgi:uncharacterized membrane protein